MTHTVSATNARNNFAEIINRVEYRGETFIIKKQGRPIAKITAVKEKITPVSKKSLPVFAMGGKKSIYSRHEIYE